MLILKGDKGKSELLHNLIGNNLYFVHCEHSINLEGFFVNSFNHSIEEFKQYIKACLYEEHKNYKENLYDYLIIYTDEKEKDLKDFISWLKDNESWFLCKGVLLVCK